MSTTLSDTGGSFSCRRLSDTRTREFGPSQSGYSNLNEGTEDRDAIQDIDYATDVPTGFLRLRKIDNVVLVEWSDSFWSQGFISPANFPT